jgi:LCP family protein required for cell wall assembly
MNSIAETLGLSPEEMRLDSDEAAEQNAASTAETEGKKLSRKEKKAAKKVEKKAAKAAKKAAKKWSPMKKALVAAVLVLALCITGFAGYFVHEMWVTDETLDLYQADFTGEIIYADDVEHVQVDQTQQVEEIPLDETRKKGCYTFLVAARDVASGCTDVIIVGRFDTENHTINMVSIPRDTMIDAKGDQKVNLAYQADLVAGGNGITGLKKEIKKLLGFEIDSYAVVDIEAVEKLIDAIGGVYFDVPMDMKYTDASQGLFIDIKKGYQKLSGADSVKVLRFRKGYANGDLGRINVQQDFIKALAEQMLDVGNIPNLGVAIEIYQEHVQSNLSAGMLLFYAKHFLEMDLNNIEFVQMPQYNGGLVNGQSFIFINPNKWVNVINEYLNPYKDDIAQGHLSIKTSSDAGVNFFYTGRR